MSVSSWPGFNTWQHVAQSILLHENTQDSILSSELGVSLLAKPGAAPKQSNKNHSQWFWKLKLEIKGGNVREPRGGFWSAENMRNRVKFLDYACSQTNKVVLLFSMKLWGEQAVYILYEYMLQDGKFHAHVSILVFSFWLKSCVINLSHLKNENDLSTLKRTMSIKKPNKEIDYLGICMYVWWFSFDSLTFHHPHKCFCFLMPPDPKSEYFAF